MKNTMKGRCKSYHLVRKVLAYGGKQLVTSQFKSNPNNPCQFILIVQLVIYLLSCN